jgi:F0F1-type ATP synthase assembly protein I
MNQDRESRSRADDSAPSGPPGSPEGKRESARAENDAWGITGTLLAGPIAWGAIGWFADRLLDTDVFLPLGLMVGMGAALYLIWVRYGRS